MDYRATIKRVLCIFLFAFSVAYPALLKAQGEGWSMPFSGQLSAYGQATPDGQPHYWLGARYIPQLNPRYSFAGERLLDGEFSLNIFGETAFYPHGNHYTHARIKPYRAWARYSSSQMELRIGLQKINFGSATMLRPLMWFDTIDPRDPLQMTDGVWAALFRYYLLNNANLWLWGLWGNDQSKGWELTPTAHRIPEAGARLQLPLSRGEMALSYHYRKAEQYNHPSFNTPNLPDMTENRFAFDMKLNLEVGLWLESSWTHTKNTTLVPQNQSMTTLGIDYTFPIGNGLAATAEHLFTAMQIPQQKDYHTTSFTALSMSYPVTFMDNLQAIFFYDWNGEHLYSYLNWQRQYNAISLYLMAYWNPENYTLAPMQSGSNRFSGKGIQLMFVWNY